MNITVACGGTGGHTFPGLAAAEVLKNRGHNVEVISAGRDIEASTMKGWNGSLFRTGAKNYKNGALKLVNSVLMVPRTLNHLRKFRPDVLLAMGSYASVTPVLAAKLLGIPVVLHEANAVLGGANGRLACLAKIVAVNFPLKNSCFPKDKVVRVGLPVRRELLSQKPRAGYGDGDFTIFVTGGSQGAVAVNRIVSKALCNLKDKICNLRVIHQTGKNMGTFEETSARYKEAGINASVHEFLTDMGSCFKVADLVIGRAGAATIAEIALFKKPSVLIPLPSAANNHQFYNAEYMVEGGASVLVKQDTDDVAPLSDAIYSLAADREKRDSMAENLNKMFLPDAEERLADLVVRQGRK